MGSDTQPTITKQTRIAIRIIDVISAFSLLLISSPVLVLVWLKRKWSFGQSIEIIYIYGIDNHLIGLYQFTGDGYWKKLPHLFNLLEGEIALLGTKAYFSFEDAPNLTIKPGLMSFDIMNKSMGISYEPHTETVTQIYKNIGTYCLAIFRALIAYFLHAMMTKHPKQAHPTTTLFGIQLNNMRMSDLIGHIITLAKNTGSMEQLAFMNADCFNISINHNAYQKALHKCKYVLADGIGVRIACLWKGVALQDNLNGTD